MPIQAGSRYVAMGSSFAAGPGIPSPVPGSPRRAGRSTGNYAHLAARVLGLDLHDVTFSGATTGDILGQSATGQPAQLDAVTEDTALVTITAGGNDVGFVPRLTLASLPWPLRALPGPRARVAELGDPRATDERFAQLERNLAEIERRLSARAPACTVLLVDYLTILPPAGHDPAAPPPAGIAAWGRAIAARLAATTRAAADAAGWGYVAASAASADHHAWSAVPWTRPFRLSSRDGAPYHPNAAGMNAVAALIIAALGELRATVAARETLAASLYAPILNARGRESWAPVTRCGCAPRLCCSPATFGSVTTRRLPWRAGPRSR